MTKLTTLSSLASALILAVTGCADQPERGTYLQNLAVCVAVDEASPVAKLAQLDALDEVALPEVDPPPPPPPPGTPHMACCTNPEGCVDHDYPLETCVQAVDGVTGVVHELTGGIAIAYGGSDPVNALFGGCEQTDCEGQPSTRFTFDLANTNAEYVVSVTDANNLVLYHVPADALGGKVRAPNGLALHPVLAATHVFANLDRPVFDSAGNLLGYIQNQSDCFDLGGVAVPGSDPATECTVEEWYCLVC